MIRINNVVDVEFVERVVILESGNKDFRVKGDVVRVGRMIRYNKVVFLLDVKNNLMSKRFMSEKDLEVYEIFSNEGVELLGNYDIKMKLVNEIIEMVNNECGYVLNLGMVINVLSDNFKYRKILEEYGNE